MINNQGRSRLISFVFVFLVAVLVFGLYKTFLKERVEDYVSDIRSQVAQIDLKKDFSAPGGLVSLVSKQSTPLTRSGIFSFTNIEREGSGLPIFLSNSKLDAVAEGRITDMLNKQYFDHEFPGGKTASVLAEERDYEYIAIGENIAMGGFEGDQDLVLAWMNSPGHRANILSNNFTEMGAAAREGTLNGDKVWLAVQIFGRPTSDCPKVDGGLKDAISARTSQAEALQAKLNTRKQELENMAKNKENRDLYNQRVAEYNSLVSELNTLVDLVKEDIAVYNYQVRGFNECINN
ncbi:MAG: hypothetical protein A2653_01485 [Candidatus Zambryskibacteria bacterium RIFCSPHIGHO2_01_FULL_43_25]|uniref:SCP domain-containing protein n=1 Tax=Candidatus Zambryskibacteria bacterium RIFCSPLOWO2_01_FULL_45_21 TaxID=1802761 RepID=A0A1G2U3W4_9BACT|nr:MAG: hypothetical protein A2653_01485 [Candidatus Zambryskibacteria bacterium RIFCSPHIGHO2_01_FULL_43_25]OHB00374.1 MAG: hypothetical protein A3E94_01555 [Candidatus Zambryskibacteria bacterium RIFCSPHIGHO2_12_FULL_44_12b]OHB04169.1 MAG: hypothetical protein A3B14_02025 [Candidatus Zambryskibacteria bacterium RIFCSPLOWO2_01_FULL_45_21]